MTEDFKIMLHTFKSAYKFLYPLLEAIRLQLDYDKIKAACEDDISEYRRSSPIKVSRSLAVIELMSKSKSEAKCMALLACMTEDDWKELENLDFKVEKNEQA